MESVTMGLWYGGSDFGEEWFADRHDYWASDIGLKIRSRQHQQEWHGVFVGWHITRVVIEQIGRGMEMSVPVPDRCSRYDSTRL